MQHLFSYLTTKNNSLKIYFENSTISMYNLRYKLHYICRPLIYWMIKLLRFAPFFLVFLIASCEGKRETLPAYIAIDKIDFNYQNVSLVGNGGTAITDAWVFDNDNLLGVFELPAVVAVATEGTHKLTVGAGIKLNGISGTRETYPYYTKWSKDITLNPLDTVSVTPKVGYYLDIGISFKEEFQDVVLKIDTVSSSDVALERVFVENQPQYLDSYVGKVYIKKATPGFKAYTKDLFMVPTTVTQPIYLELDFKCNQDFVVGYIIKAPSTGIAENQLIALRSTVVDGEMTWKHIYIDLTDQFAGRADATGFGVSFTAYYDGINPDGGYIFLDNVKVVNQKQ